MKVLYLDQTGKLGGGEIALLPWLREAHEGAKVLLFEDGPFRNAVEEMNIPVEVVESAALKGVRRESGLRAALSVLPTLWRLRARIRELSKDFDVVYANSQKAFLAAAVAKRRRQPLVWHLRDILAAAHFSRAMRSLAVFMGNRFATVIIANSQATADSFVAAGGKAEKIRVVHDGVSPSPFDRVKPETTTALREEISSSGRTLVGVFGRLSPWKGQDVLLEALSTLPEVEAVLVGDALFGEHAHVAKLKERASQPDLAGRVHFLGFRHDVPELMRAVDIVAHTSTSPEPFGLVIVEGMLAGKPVIATAAGGALEIVEDGTSGVLVPPGSVPELRQAIHVLVGDKQFRTALAIGGRRRAESSFSTVRLVEGISNILCDLHR